MTYIMLEYFVCVVIVASVATLVFAPGAPGTRTPASMSSCRWSYFGMLTRRCFRPFGSGSPEWPDSVGLSGCRGLSDFRSDPGRRIGSRGSVPRALNCSDC